MPLPRFLLGSSDGLSSFALHPPRCPSSCQSQTREKLQLLRRCWDLVKDRPLYNPWTLQRLSSMLKALIRIDTERQLTIIGLHIKQSNVFYNNTTRRRATNRRFVFGCGGKRPSDLRGVFWGKLFWTAKVSSSFWAQMTTIDPHLRWRLGQMYG
jgi:hypothetical protein